MYLFWKKKFWRTSVFFVGPLIDLPLFWTSGYVCSELQSQGGTLVCVLHCPCEMDSSDLPLVWHLLTSWWPAWWPSRGFLDPRTCTCNKKHWWGSNQPCTIFLHECLWHMFSPVFSRVLSSVLNQSYLSQQWPVISHKSVTNAAGQRTREA